MNMKEVQNMARRIGVKPRGKTKAVLIREIQRNLETLPCDWWSGGKSQGWRHY